MNSNNRDLFLPDIYEKLNGLQYYTNDFASPGICYYDLCDRYNVKIGEKTYSCVMFNDEINVTQGLEERVYTELPEETETDYTKADKTDRRINQTYLIVDKQNQVIQSLVDKTVYLTDTKNGVGSVTLENASKGLLYKLSIKGQLNLIYPQTRDDIYGSALLPKNELTPNNELLPRNGKAGPYLNKVKYPNSELYPVGAILLVDDKEYILNFDYLNYINNTTCDEFVYHNGECKIIRRVGINQNGEKYALDNEYIDNISYLDIEIDENSTIRLKSFNNAIYEVTYLLNNEYTDIFATKVEMKSSITQTAEEINLEVSRKVGVDEVISRINQTAETITIEASKVNISGVITAINNNTSTTINGNRITTGSITADKVSSEIITTSNLNAQTISCNQLSGGSISGQTISGGSLSGTSISGSEISGGSISITKGNYYFNMGTSTSNPNCSGLNVGYYGVKAYSNITATGFAITDSDTGKSGTFILRHRDGSSVVYLTFTGGILTAYDIV